MPKNNGLSIEDLEPSPELTDAELQLISGGTLTPDANGMVQVLRNGKQTSIPSRGSSNVLTPDDFGRVEDDD